MEVSGFVTAILAGIFVGVFGRLVLPGRQGIGLWLTLVVGVVAAVLGTFVAGLFDVAETWGVDWVEVALQVGLAAGGVAAVDGMRRRRITQ